MNREKRAKEYANKVGELYEYDGREEVAYGAYLRGARDAEENPIWRMCKDDLPDKPCMCVCHDGERMFFAEWVDDTAQDGLSGWNIGGLTNKPIAWLLLPELTPKS